METIITRAIERSFALVSAETKRHTLRKAFATFASATDDPNAPKVLEFFNTLFRVLPGDKRDIHKRLLQFHDNGFSPSGSFVELNAKFQDHWVESVTSLEFVSLYPTIAISIANNPTASPAFKTIAEVMNEARLFRAEEKQRVKPDQMAILGAKRWMNFAYGILNSSDTAAANRITNIGRGLCKFLYTEFAGHCIYVDTDTAYFTNFSEVKERLQKELGRKCRIYGLDYELNENAYQGIFRAKKKYLLVPQDTLVKRVGIRSF